MTFFNQNLRDGMKKSATEPMGEVDEGKQKTQKTSIISITYYPVILYWLLILEKKNFNIYMVFISKEKVGKVDSHGINYNFLYISFL